MRALVTGGTGFAGSHLMEALRRSTSVEVFGTCRENTDQADLRCVDLTDYEAVVALLDELRPETIYHLAAFASPARRRPWPPWPPCRRLGRPCD